MHTDDSVARQREALLSLVQLDKSDLETSLVRILEADARALDVERVSYWRLSEDRSQLVCERLFSLAAKRLTSGEVLLGRDYPRYFASLLENRAILAHDARLDPRTSEFSATYFAPHGITSMLDVPVWQQGRLAGVLCHEHVGTPRTWLSTESDFALSVGGMIAVALEGRARYLAETRYELLTSALQDLVWEWNLRTNHIAWNDAALPGLRFMPGEVRPNYEWWLENVHPDDLQRVTSGLDQHVASGSGVWRDEYRFRRGDGTWAIIADRGVVERAKDGTGNRMVGAMVDVTETRALESRLAISDRMASVGTLAAGVAHEINNPLSFVGLNLAWALGATTDPAIRRALEEAQEGVERVQQIVRDLNTFSRPHESERSTVDVRETIASALGIARNELRHRARVREEYGPTPPARCSAARLGQVILNLLMNAAQAIPDGRADDNEILLRTGTTTDGQVRIEVLDTGVGIPPELSQRIFDPFFTTKAVGEGTGLGLAICHSIVSAAGGSLSLENRPGGGAIARVELPAAAEPPAVAKRAPVPGPRQLDSFEPARKGRVLIIDDVVNVGRSMKLLLQDRHEVQLFTRARDAVEALARGERWDVILCDLMMPELNGMEFVAEVRRIDATVVPRVVLMSGGAFTEQAREFLRGWPYRTLEKPISPEVLEEQVAQAVREAAGSGGERPVRS